MVCHNFFDFYLLSDYDERCNLKLPATVLDDSGIGSSLRQLKENNGLESKSQNQLGEGSQKVKGSVRFQLEETCNNKNAQNRSQKDSGDNVVNTSPNSLVGNIPISVLESTNDSLDSMSLEEKVTGSTKITECDSLNNADEDTSSDSTLVSSVQNVGDLLSPKGETPTKPSTLSENNERYNPVIPIQYWTPVKAPHDRPSTSRDCYNDGRGLPPDQWTPTKSQKQEVSRCLL